MSRAWQILHRAGVPLAGDREGKLPAPDEIAAALREVLAEPPAGREAEALAAFVLAWQAEFPSSFSSLLRLEEAGIVAWAKAQLADPNRFLKLRRIAISHLATVL